MDISKFKNFKLQKFDWIIPYQISFLYKTNPYKLGFYTCSEGRGRNLYAIRYSIRRTPGIEKKLLLYIPLRPL